MRVVENTKLIYSDEDDRPRFSDPYAGIFFSKDRVERIVEPVHEEQWVEVDVPAEIDGVVSENRKTRVRLLAMSEWMSGCPEGSKSG
jgi:hypothetical protein